MHNGKAAGWSLLGISCCIAAIVISVGVEHNKVEARPPVEAEQTVQVWTARQHALWQAVETREKSVLAEEKLRAQKAAKAEAADIAKINKGDQAAMIRQSSRENTFIRSVIAKCDPAVARQLSSVAEFAWPLKGAMKVTSPYGERMHPIIGEEAFHRGVDLRAAYGSPVYAPADGVVLYTGRKTTYGNMIILLHGGGVATVYGHLWKFAVHAYERVARGRLLGYSGNTGFSTGPHLHFEVRQNGEPTNPLEWLPPIATTGSWEDRQ